MKNLLENKKNCHKVVNLKLIFFYYFIPFRARNPHPHEIASFSKEIIKFKTPKTWIYSFVKVPLLN